MCSSTQDMRRLKIHEYTCILLWMNFDHPTYCTLQILPWVIVSVRITFQSAVLKKVCV